MKLEDIKVGDTVQLNSGGCPMTVAKVGNNLTEAPICCSWLDKTDRERYACFRPEMLEDAGRL